MLPGFQVYGAQQRVNARKTQVGRGSEKEEERATLKIRKVSMYYICIENVFEPEKRDCRMNEILLASILKS